MGATTLASGEDSRHARFLDSCLLYGEFNRPVFLEAILRWFVESANAEELAALRHAISDRGKALKRNGKRGRPRAEESWDWLRASVKLVWHREVEHWSWRRIATAAGIKPTKANIRTLRNRLGQYAMLVWDAAVEAGYRRDEPHALARMLEAKRIQRWFRSRVALPFDTHPRECKQTVLKLAPRGLEVAAKHLRRTPIRRPA